MEDLCSNFVVKDIIVNSIVEALVVEISVYVTKSLACLLLMMKFSTSGITIEFPRETRQFKRFSKADFHEEKQPDQAKGASETGDDDEDTDVGKDDEDDDGDDEEDVSGEEEDDEDDLDSEDEPEASGDGGSGDDDDDNDDEDGEEEEEEEEDDEESPQPPAKKRK